ncbi:MAG: SPOR domain-containing protein [Geminicoccaceae bacterium]
MSRTRALPALLLLLGGCAGLDLASQQEDTVPVFGLREDAFIDQASEAYDILARPGPQGEVSKPAFIARGMEIRPSASTADLAARFDGLDGNGDGYLTRDEYLAVQRQLFVHADHDGNGVLSPMEEKDLHDSRREAFSGNAVSTARSVAAMDMVSIEPAAGPSHANAQIIARGPTASTAGMSKPPMAKLETATLGPVSQPALPSESDMASINEQPPANGPYLQIASIVDRSLADSEWQRLQERHPSQLAGHDMRVRAADTPVGTVYRLQIGPLMDLATAESLCHQLISRGQGCLPVASN